MPLFSPACGMKHEATSGASTAMGIVAMTETRNGCRSQTKITKPSRNRVTPAATTPIPEKSAVAISASANRLRQLVGMFRGSLVVVQEALQRAHSITRTSDIIPRTPEVDGAWNSCFSGNHTSVLLDYGVPDDKSLYGRFHRKGLSVHHHPRYSSAIPSSYLQTTL
jgi:hypothetical protein